MKKDNEKAPVTGKSIPRNNRAGISDTEVEEVLRSAKEQLARNMGEQKVTKKEVKDKSIEQQREDWKAQREKKAQEARKAEEERKAQEARKAEQERKAQEARKAGQERKAQEAGKAGQENKAREVKSAQQKREEQQFNIEDTVYVDNNVGNPMPEKDRISIGDIIGGFFEFIWTIVKLTVVVCIVVGVVGFLLTRNLMIRGRTGERVSVSGMKTAGNVTSNKESEDQRVKEWLNEVKREKVTLTADDHSILVARKIVVNKDSDKWAVILHGFNGSMEDIYDVAMHYTEEGFNVLMPDLRANGESEGAFHGMGWTDRMDVINWIDLILQDNPSAQISIHGIDIGADAALMLSGEPVKSSIKAIVAEGAYTSAWDVVKKEYEARYDWPVFPIVNMMNPVTKIWGGYSLKEADAVKQVKNANVPILLIHGKNDTYATSDMTKQLEKEIASSHEVLEISTGTHEDCRYAEPDTYYNKTFEFVETYVK